MPFILEKVCWIVEHSLVDNGSDPKFTEHVTNMTLGVLIETLIEKILGLPQEKQSEKTALMDYLIRLMQADSKYEILKDMIKTSKLDYEGKTVATVNKLQKWACVQKIAACVSSKVEADEVAELADGLLAEDSSDVAQLQYAKY